MSEGRLANLIHFNSAQKTCCDHTPGVVTDPANARPSIEQTVERDCFTMSRGSLLQYTFTDKLYLVTFLY